MSELTWAPLRETEELTFRQLVLEFWEESDETSGFMTTAKVSQTIARSKSHPDELEITLFRQRDTAVGYVILSSFWSNEYGGMITIVDELYIQPAFQGMGTASAFLEELSQRSERQGLLLEVFPENQRAFELYRRLGFEVIDRIFMQKHRG